MEKKQVLANFKRCLADCSLERMRKPLYEFFHLRCSFIAHYNLNGFKAAYAGFEFKDFLTQLKYDLEDKPQCDKDDSFKYGYNFSIPELKAEMLAEINAREDEVREKLGVRRCEEIAADIARLEIEKKHLLAEAQHG